MNSRLCLGTAQFGLDYGITNQNGKVKDKELDLLLRRAHEKNIIFFDTANAYGNSERIIGEKLDGEDVKIITKFSANNYEVFTNENILLLDKEFKKSLKRLKRDSIEAYLLHNPNDLKKENSQLLLNWLKELKNKKLIKKFGVSIYDESDIENLPLEDLQIIQLPLSIYDQRLLNYPFINRLLKLGISIHVRSIFLQGLLLQKSSNWPRKINPEFRNHHNEYERVIKENDLNLLESAITFIKELDFAELVLFGVTNIEELNSFIRCWESQKTKINKVNFSNFKWNKINDIDPRKWNTY